MPSLLNCPHIQCWAVMLCAFIRGVYAQELAVEPRLNEIQVIGTHNSYHIAPVANMAKLIGVAGKSLAEAIDYTHRPLAEQFSELGIRQIELDVYADPMGGLYANPIGRKMLLESEENAGPDPDANGVLQKPGMKIIHSPGFDFMSTVPTLKVALQQVQQWSTQHPKHLPIMILIEVKETTNGPSGVKAVEFDTKLLDDLDEEIRSVFPTEQMLTPDQVRGTHETLRDALRTDGWPVLSRCRGKVMFALDNEDRVREKYLEKHGTLENRLLFASVHESHASAAWMKINDPIRDFEKIQRMIRAGFMVRTRADANTIQARKNDPTQRDQAFASGAQFISTDYPEADKRFSTYRVHFANGIIARTNPLIGNPSLEGKELE